MNEPRVRLLPLIAAIGGIILQAAAIVVLGWALMVWMFTS